MDTKIIRVGVISSVDAKNHTAKVVFSDKDDTVSHDLPVLMPNTQDTKFYCMPSVGEQVLCAMEQNMSGSGSKNGYILGAVYSDVDKPKETDSKVKSVHFASGSYIREDGEGNIEIHGAASIKITAPRIDLN